MSGHPFTIHKIYGVKIPLSGDCISVCIRIKFIIPGEFLLGKSKSESVPSPQFFKNCSATLYSPGILESGQVNVMARLFSIRTAHEQGKKLV